jgi:UDP-N-acetylmuramyl pentapeptide phosphotransferase/UDP-N-acetylglucosamine-1-phosphate transferase
MTIYLIIYLLIIFFLNNLIIKKNFLSSDTGSVHQLFANKSVPLTGGIILILPISYIFFGNENILVLTFLLFFILGLLSDLNILSSSKKRFLLQFLIILFFVLINKLEVLPTRVSLIDEYFQNSSLSYFFTIFCFLVLINGSNFIDGLNGLLVGYILIIFFYLYKLNLISSLDLNNDDFLLFIVTLIFLLSLNLNNKLFLGDSGSYSLSFLLGFILIKIYNLNLQISPYFIILLLWYPCFENLFSITRKSILKLNPLKPDNNHLHQYLFIFLKKKFNYRDLVANNLASILINFFNFTILYIASIDIYHTKFQLCLLLFCVTIYLICFRVLKNSLKLL